METLFQATRAHKTQYTHRTTEKGKEKWITVYSESDVDYYSMFILKHKRFFKNVPKGSSMEDS